MDWLTWWFPNIMHKLKIGLFLTLIWLLGLEFRSINGKLKSCLQSTTVSQVGEFINFSAVIQVFFLTEM